jgi:hypothetical protein
MTALFLLDCSKIPALKNQHRKHSILIEVVKKYSILSSKLEVAGSIMMAAKCEMKDKRHCLKIGCFF